MSWPRDVGCVYAETGDAIVLVDPLVPQHPDGARRFWRALDRDRRRLADRPVVILLTASWHRRSSEEIARRYDATVWELGAALPAGVDSDVFQAGEWQEAVFGLPEYAAVVFGDVVQGDGDGGLCMDPDWWPPDDPRTVRVRAELRRLLRWPIDHVLVSHGEPVVDRGRAALERALGV
jgi:hypothetical protein